MFHWVNHGITILQQEGNFLSDLRLMYSHRAWSTWVHTITYKISYQGTLGTSYKYLIHVYGHFEPDIKPSCHHIIAVSIWEGYSTDRNPEFFLKASRVRYLQLAVCLLESTQGHLMSCALKALHPTHTMINEADRPS